MVKPDDHDAAHRKQTSDTHLMTTLIKRGDRIADDIARAEERAKQEPSKK